ncbi:MAG: Uma2 family endonuclease, partial [Roseimicrobium sp.]
MNAAVLPQPPAMTFPVVEEIDISHLVTEDDTPVENFAAEQQMRLLSEAPNCSWDPGRDFIVAANVGVFCAVARPPIVPDVMVVLDVPRPPHDYAKKEYRSYFMWIYGKPPDIVVEIVSNREGGELDSKLAEYARLRVAYYAVYDPRHLIQETNLACFVLIGDGYEPLPMAKFKHTGLSLVEWEGTYEHNVGPWLRWADEQGNLILTGAELAEVA